MFRQKNVPEAQAQLRSIQGRGIPWPHAAEPVVQT
jgi:hypothetical protein